MMRPMENPKKDTRWYQRGIAILLLACCVLSVVPSNFFAFANWIIRDSTPGEKVEPTTGEYTVNLKYFADNMYFPESNDSVVTYFAYDPATNKETGTEYREFDLSKFTPVALSRENSTTSVVLDHTNTSTVYCDKRSHANVCTHKDTKNGMLKFSAANIELNIGDYSVNLLDDSITSSLSVNIVDKSDETIELVSSKEYRLGVVSSTTDEDGVTTLLELYIVVSDASLLVGIDNFSTSGKQCSNGLFGLGASDATKTYTATSSSFRGFGGTYKCYVKKTVGQAAYTESNLTQIKSKNDANGILHKIENLTLGSEIVMPSYAELQSYLPTDYVSYEWIKEQYPIGYYLGAQMETDNNKGTQIESFPYVVNASDADSEKVITIWVEWGVLPPNTAKGDINAEIATKNATGSGTVSIYNVAAPSTGFSTIQKDKAQLTSSANAWGLYTDIASGVTVEFCMNNGETDINAREGEEPSKTENYNLSDGTVSLSNNTRDYTVVLQKDITINNDAFLYIGGHTASYRPSGKTNSIDGYIAGNYVALDLNGHNLIVKGTLHSFGYIYDSVGTGKIIVNESGTLYTQFVIHGITGFDHTLKAFDVGYCPFYDYNLPYLDAEVEIVASSSDSGKFVGFAAMMTSTAEVASISIPMVNMYVGIVDVADALFSVKAKASKAYTRMEVSEISNLDDLESQCLNKKNIFTLENVDATLTPPDLTFAVPVLGEQTLKLVRCIFPISPLVDAYFKSSTLTLKQKIMVCPGSTVTIDSDSSLIMSTQTAKFDSIGINVIVLKAEYISKVNERTYSGGIYVVDRPLKSQTADVGKSGQLQLHGMAFGSTYGVSSFWNRFDGGVVNIYGIVEFKANTSTDEPYILSGNINISKYKTPNTKDADGNIVAFDWDIANIKSEHFSGTNFVSYGALGILAQSGTGTTGSDHETNMYNYFTMPLNSNGEMYLVDTAVAVVGSFDDKTGLFTSGEKRYAISPGVEALPVKGIIVYTPKAYEVDFSNGVIAANGKNYAYYCGVLNPLTITTSGTGTTYSITGKLLSSSASTSTIVWDGSKWALPAA